MIAIAVLCLFASIYFIPKPLHSSIFFASQVVLLVSLLSRLPGLMRANWPFLILVALFVAVTLANGYDRSINSSMLGRNLGSVVMVPVFCFTIALTYGRLGWRMMEILLIVAVVAALLAFGEGVWSNRGHVFTERFDAPGTGRNAIQFAGLMAAGIIVAAIDVADGALSRNRRIVEAACIGLFVALSIMSGSRGPLIALVLTLIAAFFFFARKREAPHGVKLLIPLVCAWAVITGVVFLSLFFERVYCPFPAQLCRSAERVDIWGWVVDQVIMHPFLGAGADFRFSVLGKGHAHNAIWGLFLAFGIPMALIWLGGIGTLIARARPAELGRKGAMFACLMLVYGFAYMGSDLPTPFTYMGPHYIFLWLPLALLMTTRRSV